MIRTCSPRALRLVLACSALLAPAVQATAQDGSAIVVGVAAPLSGPSSILGEQVAAGAAGATAAARGAGAGTLRTVAADTRCTAEGGVEAARGFAAAGVSAVAGFLCTAALEAALPILTEAGIPVIAVGVRANRVTDRRDRTGFLVWRLAPRSDAEAAALADFVASEWSDVPFGIVEDGSVYGRDLADAVRTRLEEQGLRPALFDNYRPAEERQFSIARRIAQSGVTHVLLLGERADVAIIARDAAELGVDLRIVGGEALVDAGAAEVPLADGVLAIAEGSALRPPPATNGDDPAAPREGYVDAAFAAVEIAAAAIRQAEASGRSVPEILNGTTFETRLGPVRFDQKGDADRDAFSVFEWQGDRFVAATDG